MVKNMNEQNRRWINEHMDELKRKYDDKIVIVSENRVVKVLHGDTDPLEINKIAAKICRGKDWDYTYVCREEEYLL